MTGEEFGRVFEKVQAQALRTVRAKLSMGPQEAADAVQDAAVYCMENLARFKRITPSYFIQLAVNRGRNIHRANRRRWDHEYPVGSWHDLDIVERIDAAVRSGRAYNPALKSGKDATKVVVRLPDDDAPVLYVE